jgi:CcmD family protein
VEVAMTTTMRGRCVGLATVVLILLAVAAPVLALAAQPPAGGAQPAQDEFVPVKDLPQQEQLPGGPLVLGAYGFVWAVLLVYVWTVWRRLGKVEREMRDLAGRVKRHEG